MLVLTPKPCRPDQQLVKSLKMFQPELRKQKCGFEYSVDTTYVEMDIDWVLADLVRVGQVLINLMTNAIKFTTHKAGERKISCRVGASSYRPDSYPPHVVFFDTDTHACRLDVTERPEWGDGEPLYVMFAVRDTGIGISDEGQKRLFERFNQATPRTGVIYGGSGLGLNISRKLVHLHGGEIGVASREGQGTTIGFFFRVRRSGPPRENLATAEDVDWEDERFRGQIRARGMIAPIEVNPSKLSQSLRHPFIRSATDEMRRQEMERPGDDRLEHTAGLVSEAVDVGRQEEEGKSERGSGLQHTNERKASFCPERPDTGTLKERRILSRKLASKGFIITVANNGREAVEAVRKTMHIDSRGGSEAEAKKEIARFDVILMDQEMPVMDGNAAAREIRRLEHESKTDERERVPILGVTANVRGEQLDAMRESGMDDVPTRPYRTEDMVKIIWGLIENVGGI
ncbi:hypothetical protein LTR53_001387 [Teratosphaeriaceae sp. CCFEE 6253]|nr:hypothetical protein LTR53_001387 [Teratosphaeriaceae sp. CCFEE 6253]